MRSQAITEAANLIAQSVPDLKRLAALLSIAGGCERIVNALPVNPPTLIRFVGSQTRALGWRASADYASRHGRRTMGGLIAARNRPSAHAFSPQIHRGIHAMSAWRTFHSIGRGATDTRRLGLAAAVLCWLGGFALISALIADAFP
jgi:hypothetical protein